MTSLLAPIEATPYVGGTANSYITVDVNGLQVTLPGIDGELPTWSAAGVPAVVAAGSSGQVLTSNGAGAAPTFQAAGGGSPGGADTELQYNNGGAFGSLVNVTYNDGTSVITVGFADELSGLVGSGTDIDAADLTIKVPVSTGSADPGTLIIQTTDVGTTGSTAQILQNRFVFDGPRIGIQNTAESVLIGDLAGANLDLAADRFAVCIGNEAGEALTTGTSNMFLGFQAGAETTTGSNNVAIGKEALELNVIGSSNLAIGFRSLQVATGSDNVGLGRNSLLRNTTGLRNMSIGSLTMQFNLTGNDNVAIGNRSLQASLGSGSVAIGTSTLQNQTTGNNNVAIGSSALFDNVTGARNVGIGSLALGDSTGVRNIGIGYQAGRLLTSDENTLIGYQAGNNITSGGSNLVIGAEVDTQSATGSNQVSIGNLITGNATAIGTTAATGSVGIGTFAFATGTTLGVLCFPDNTADPAPAADTACFYANDVGGTNVTPFATDEANNVEPCVPFAEAVTLGSAVTTFVADANLVTVTGDGGANTIATITGARAFAGSRVVLLFVDALVTITDDDTHAANSVDLQGAATNFVSADDTTLELIHNGTSWYEISRSVN